MTEEKRAKIGDQPAQLKEGAGLSELKLFLRDDLVRAWQRCSWIIVNETGRERTDIMEEMVHDFLRKYNC